VRQYEQAKISSPRYQAHLRAANANGADVYLSVNALRPGAQNRAKADVQDVRHLYLDVDTDGEAVLKNIFAAMPKPSTVLQSSPGKYQLLWGVEGFGKNKAEAAVRGMAAQFNADQAVWDCARILRIPGFRNWKYPARHYVREIDGERSVRVLTPNDFPVFPEATRVGAPRSLTHAGGSQSESDWAFALRSLERGMAPAEIEEKIKVSLESSVGRGLNHPLARAYR
jgi:hypothetical protein